MCLVKRALSNLRIFRHENQNANIYPCLSVTMTSFDVVKETLDQYVILPFRVKLPTHQFLL